MRDREINDATVRVGQPDATTLAPYILEQGQTLAQKLWEIMEVNAKFVEQGLLGCLELVDAAADTSGADVARKEPDLSDRNNLPASPSWDGSVDMDTILGAIDSTPFAQREADAGDRHETRGDLGVTVNSEGEITSITGSDGHVYHKEQNGKWSVTVEGKEVPDLENVKVDENGNLSYDLGDSHIVEGADGSVSWESKTDGNKMVWDKDGRVTESQAGDGPSRKFHYNDNGELDQIDGKLGHWDRTVDKDGNVEWVNKDSADVWRGDFTVDGEGNLHYKGRAGGAWIFTWDGRDVNANEVTDTSERDAAPKSTEYSNGLRITRSEGQTVTDALDDGTQIPIEIEPSLIIDDTQVQPQPVRQELDKDDNPTGTILDGNDKPVYKNNADGSVTVYEQDSEGRPQTTTEYPSGIKITTAEPITETRNGRTITNHNNNVIVPEGGEWLERDDGTIINKAGDTTIWNWGGVVSIMAKDRIIIQYPDGKRVVFGDVGQSI